MNRKPVVCPRCGKTALFHIGGCGATYEIKCRNNRCDSIITIYSAGQTAIQKELTFSQYEYLVKSNRGIDITKTV